MSDAGEFSVRPIRRLSDERTPTDPKTKQRAQRLLQQGYAPDRDGRSVRRQR